MSVLPVGFGASGGIDTGDIQNSLRFRSNASAYLSRTITTDATSTYFAAVKRGRLGVISPIFDTNIRFNANDTMTAFGLTTTAVFRDPTSWLFIHVSNGGLYVNGVSYGAVTTSALTNPRIGYDSTNYFDGYIARIGCVAGSSSSYANFGYYNEIGVWTTKTQSQVKAVVDAGGTNSFMLDFDDATSLTTLGYDKSSKGNNWTLNNVSLTAGVTYDHMLDVPGNSYAVLNNIFPSVANISYANLRSGTTAVRGTIPCTEFNSYWEVTAAGANVTAGVIDAAASANTTTVTANKVFAFEMTTTGTIKYRNVTDAGSWTDIATGLSGARWPYGITAAADWNFGQRPFAYTPPEGFQALCQRNLPEPSILKPYEHFGVLTYTGDGTADHGVTGAGFTPDLAWIKNRAQADNHKLVDILRGVTNELESNTADAEVANADGLLSFDSGGFSVGADLEYNTNTENYVSWLWKANGTGVTNTDGTITSTVSANQEAGFSIVTYTGNGTADTVGHGLGVAPKMVVVKDRDDTATNWCVYHSAIGAANRLLLNLTNASGATANWNSTVPTTTVFSLGASAEVSANTKKHVAYCFAEIEGYSKFGSYTGNGSADGPFIFTNFRPAFVITKRTDSSSGWALHDSKRSPFNGTETTLYLDSSNAEINPSTEDVDFLSNGFKIRSTTIARNASGGTYIFIAFAETPYKYSNSR